MADTALLSTANLDACIPVATGSGAELFYRDVLGLKFTGAEVPFAFLFDSNGTGIRATLPAEPGFPTPPTTVLGWSVVDIAATIGVLMEAGITFNRYAGLNESDPLGIWTSPSGTRFAWFADPFGNLLSLQQAV